MGLDKNIIAAIGTRLPVLHKVYSRLLGSAALREVQSLPASGPCQILGLATVTDSEAHRLRSEYNRTKGLLEDMIRRFGLSSESLEKQRPALFRDFEHLCRRCAAVRRCSHADGVKATAAECEKFCPNASSLRKLAGQVRG